MPDKSRQKAIYTTKGLLPEMDTGKKQLILFEEDDWSLKQDYREGYYSVVEMVHKHKDWLGRPRWVRTNCMDVGVFYSWSRDPRPDWDDQCSKCGDGPPPDLKTRFRLLDDDHE